MRNRQRADEGVDTSKLASFLWDKHRILAVAIMHEEFDGIRVSPHVYTTLEELDRFCDLMEGTSNPACPRRPA